MAPEQVDNRSGEILCRMGSDVSRMGYRHIWGECGMWSSDEGKLGAKTSVQAPYLSPGFGDFGDGHDGIACMGVGCESDDRKGFVGWDGRLDHNLYIEPECRFGTQQVDSPHRSLGLSRIVVLSTDYETMRFAQQTYSIVVGFP